MTIDTEDDAALFLIEPAPAFFTLPDPDCWRCRRRIWNCLCDPPAESSPERFGCFAPEPCSCPVCDGAPW